MRLVQFHDEGSATVRVAVVSDDGAKLDVVAVQGGTFALAGEAARSGRTMADTITGKGVEATVGYDKIYAGGCLLPPITHPDPAHLRISGTGLTHLGSASARDAMHERVDRNEDDLTDSMKMFKWGLDGGKPKPGETGVQPEWFFKGDGSWLVAPGAALELPDYAQDGGEEPEIAGIYLIGEDGSPWRVGFVLMNEFSDHVMERRNYLFLAHSKLRTSSIGPELLIGDLPASVEGTSRILRNGKVLWEKPFVSGEANMSHSIANLERHHFKYARFRHPGDVHVHCFGTATLSFADKVTAEPGDVFEISAKGFGKPLANPLVRTPAPVAGVRAL
jgi:hypothetical protein